MIDETAKLNVAGMITLYNSEQDVLQRIGTYIDQVQKLYAVDNSEQKDIKLIESIVNAYPTVKYISNGGNQGIAHALNVAAKAAIRDHFAYLLMMDDDSETPTNLVSTLYAVAIRNSSENVGIVAAQSDTNVRRNDEQETITTITSGSLLNLKAYQATGPFLDDLFIDWVDHEYCFRLAKHGYRIVIANQIKLTHRLGVFKTKLIINLIPVRWRSHSPTRLYYKFRNSIYVMNSYKRQLPFTFILPVYYELLRDIAKIVFMEAHKGAYLTSVKRGLLDAYKKRLGKLPD